VWLLYLPHYRPVWPRGWVEVLLYSSMTVALEGDEWSAARPGRTLPPGKDPVPILQEAGWAPGPVWTSRKSRPYRDSIPDRPAHSQSLYRLSYPAHTVTLMMPAFFMLSMFMSHTPPPRINGNFVLIQSNDWTKQWRCILFSAREEVDLHV